MAVQLLDQSDLKVGSTKAYASHKHAQPRNGEATVPKTSIAMKLACLAIALVILASAYAASDFCAEQRQLCEARCNGGKLTFDCKDSNGAKSTACSCVDEGRGGSATSSSSAQTSSSASAKVPDPLVTCLGTVISYKNAKRWRRANSFGLTCRAWGFLELRRSTTAVETNVCVRCVHGRQQKCMSYDMLPGIFAGMEHSKRR